MPSGHTIARVAVQVSIVGSGVANEACAEEIGRLLATRGCTVVCGGRGEVMAAAARGAKSAGGTTIGIVPSTSRAEANEWIDHVVVTGLGHARNAIVAASGDAVIAVGGSYGTLTEIGFAKVFGRPVVIVEPGLAVEGVPRAATPAEAVELALSSLGSE
jgi:uncharacterized protein (TIGR00725 family)